MYFHPSHFKDKTATAYLRKEPLLCSLMGNQSLLQRMKTASSTSPSTSSSGIIQRRITQTYNEFAQEMSAQAGTAPPLPPNRIQYIYANHVLRPEIAFIERLYDRSWGWENDQTHNDLLSTNDLDNLLEILRPVLSYMHLPLAERGPFLQSASQLLMNALTPLWNQEPENCRQLETTTRYTDDDMATAPELQRLSNDIFTANGIALTDEQKGGHEYVTQTVHMTVPEFRAAFHSPQLIQLMFDIHYTWRTNQGALDRRRQFRLPYAPANDGDEDRRTSRVTTDDTPGAIRSFHGDEQHRLPGRTPAELAAPHAAASTYLSYVNTRANTTPKIANKTLIEYTGIRLGQEPNPHNNKIIFDYHTGIMYVTFNHYHMLYEVDMTTF